MNPITKIAIPFMVTLALMAKASATVQIPLYGGVNDETWQNITIPGVNQTIFTKSTNGALIADSMAGFGMVVRELEQVEDYPILRWRWRIERHLPPTDASKKGGDDRPIAVHVWFPMADSETSIWTSIGDTLSGLIGLPPSGRVITYMCGGKHKAGTSFRNPHLPDRGMIVIRRDNKVPISQWMTEEIDVAADYQRLFGTSAPTPSHIAISADTDDTGLKSRAAIADISFVAKPKKL